MNDQRSQLAQWKDALLGEAGRDARAPQHEVSFAGHDPVYPTCFRAGEAAAAALGAAASAAADLWQRAHRSGFAADRGRDGRWIHLHGGFRSREGTLGLLGCADDADAIARTVATWDAQALEDALAERG